MKRELGNSGLYISDISFGCVELGIPYGIGVSGREDMLSERDAITLLHTAVDRGINFFDTAPAYGTSETILGRAFRDLRDQVLICTKCPSLTDESGKVLQGKALRERLEGALLGSLDALGTDYVDVYMLHQVTDSVIADPEVVALFDEFRQRGLIRLAGASTYPGGITGRVIDSGNWPVIQLAMNLMDQRETAYLAQAQRAGIGIIVRSVLFKGILTDRGRNLHPALQAVSDHRQHCIDAVPANSSLSKFATQYVLQQTGVSSVLLGIDRMAYLEQALACSATPPLTPEQLAACKDLAFPDPDALDLPAWDRKGWLS